MVTHFSLICFFGCFRERERAREKKQPEVLVGLLKLIMRISFLFLRISYVVPIIDWFKDF